MSNEVVKYHNDLNKIKFIGFNEKELNVFFSLVFLAKEQGIRELVIPFSELRILSNNDKGKHKKRFIDILNSLNEKLVSLHQQIKVGNKTYTFSLFNTFIVDEDEDVLSVEVNKIFSYMLNDLVGKFTKFELIDLVSLKSSYSKTLFTLLKQWANLKKKEKKFTLDEFKELLGVKGNYERFSSFDTHVLGQLRKDLTSIIPNFNLKLEKTGRQYTHITVIWGAGKVDNEVIDYKEDDIQEIKVSKGVLDYIKNVCKHNRFIKEVLDEEENLIYLLEKFQGKQVALVKGLEFAKKEIQKEINLTYLIKTVRTGAGVKKMKKILKIVKDEVAVPKEVPTEQPAPTVPSEDKVEVPKIPTRKKVTLSEFEELYKQFLTKEHAKDTEQTKRFYKMGFDIVDDVEVPAKDKVEVEEKPIEQKEEKKVYTVEDIPADKLLTKAGKKLGGSALENRIRKILKEMNGE